MGYGRAKFYSDHQPIIRKSPILHHLELSSHFLSTSPLQFLLTAAIHSNIIIITKYHMTPYRAPLPPMPIPMQQNLSLLKSLGLGALSGTLLHTIFANFHVSRAKFLHLSNAALSDFLSLFV